MEKLISILRCPKCNDKLKQIDDKLICKKAKSHEYSMQNGIPVLVTKEDMQKYATDKITEYYNNVAEDYDVNHRVVFDGAQWVLKNQTWPLFNEKLDKNESILEIGAGTGYFTSFLISNGYNVLSGDLSLPMLSVNLQKHPSHDFCGFTSENMPFEANSFDCIVGNNTFYLYNNKKKFLSEISRVLKPGGKLYLSEMNPYFPLWYTRNPNKLVVDLNVGGEIEKRLLESKKVFIDNWIDQSDLELLAYKPYSNIPYFAGPLLKNLCVMFNYSFGLIPYVQKYLGIRVWIEMIKR